MPYIDVDFLSSPRIILVVSGLVVSRTTIDGDAKDTLALIQVVETRINEAIAVVLATSLGLCQTLGICKRNSLQSFRAIGYFFGLFVVGCGMPLFWPLFP